MQWQNSIEINRPVNDVFHFVTDADGGTKWHRANQITPVSEEPIKLGSKYRVQGRFLFWSYDSISEVTEFEKNRRVTYHSDAGMYTYSLRYILEPTETGTHFTEIGEANPKGLIKLVIRLFLGGAHKNSKKGLRLLKSALELQS